VALRGMGEREREGILRGYDISFLITAYFLFLAQENIPIL